MASDLHKNGLAEDEDVHTLQIIDEDQQFTQSLPGGMKTWGLYDQGFNYDIVAVFGSQSTGKSTLLNALFGTDFDVMNESERRQTTKGIWMAKGKQMPVLVMDVEGTDGRERGENQDFERKSALFSMASSEVILINIWENQVGLFQGANLGLLKTVFEVNLSLFVASSASSSNSASAANKQKTLLLFVIRDYAGTTPLENLTRILQQDLTNIWDKLAKPPGFESSSISEYFDMAFDALPHKIYQPEKFTQEVARLRTRFNNPQVEDYVFKPLYHKRIPADGVAPYMAGIWDQVVNNKDLDLPTQQELLAQFRCDELAAAAFSEFEAALLQMQSIIATALPAELGQAMTTARNAALSKFDKDASRYHTGVYTRRRGELAIKVHAALLPLFSSQLKQLHKRLLAEFKSGLVREIRSGDYDFAEVVGRLQRDTESKFVEDAGALLLPESEWNFEETLGLLREDMQTTADSSRAEETKKMVATLERSLKKQIAEPVELALNKASDKMWDHILSVFSDALAKSETVYKKKAKSFNCTDEEIETALRAIRKRGWLVLRSKLDEQTSDANMLVKLKLAFEERFRYDSDGVPRVWKPTDDIDGLFKKAKDETLALISLYAIIKPSDPDLAVRLPSETEDELDPTAEEFDFDATLVVFSDSKQEELASRFRREADAYYVEAKRSLVSSISQIPVWIYAVMAFLGWNEFVAVLRSPLYFTTLALLAGISYVIFMMGMAGPVLKMGQAAYDQAVVSVNEKLREHFAPPQASPVAPHTHTTRRERDEQDNIELKQR